MTILQQRALSSDRRAGWVARRSVRERHRHVLRTQWRWLLAFAGTIFALFTVAAVFADGPLQQGLLLGSGGALAACGAVALVVLTSGTAPLMMGELAEQWTAQELRRLRKHGWRLINHFGLGHGDYDHVLVGPGGVVLVETKWGGSPWDVDARDTSFRRGLEQAAANAKQLSLWDGVRKHGRPHVEAVLVVWGPAGRNLRELPARRHESGVVVLSGDQLEDWMLGRGRQQLTAERAAAIWEEIDRHAVRRDEHERVSQPMPTSLGRIALAACTSLAPALACFLLSGEVLESTASLTAWMAVGAALVVGAELVRRRSRLAWQARVFQIGILGLYLITLVAIARAYVVG
jgi:hypothetical protein